MYLHKENRELFRDAISKCIYILYLLWNLSDIRCIISVWDSENVYILGKEINMFPIII